MKQKRNFKKDGVKNIEINCYKKNIPMVFFANEKAIVKLSKLNTRVSPRLFDVMLASLLGFESEIQLVLADCWTDFILNHNLYCTGCLPIDTVLDKVYTLIVSELCIDNKKYVEAWNKIVEDIYL